MAYTVTCDCERSIVVRVGDAGSQKMCGCGTLVNVPSLSDLRECEELDSSIEEPSQQSDLSIVMLGIASFGILVVGVISAPLLLPLGLLMVLSGRVWFAMQILREMTLPNAMMVFFIPFMPTVFLFMRFDIAWKPFLFSVVGFVVFVVGVVACLR